MQDVLCTMEHNENRTVGYLCNRCGHFQGFDGLCENCGCMVDPISENDSVLSDFEDLPGEEACWE